MNARITATAAVAVALVGLAATHVASSQNRSNQPERTASPGQDQQVAQMISSWPESSRMAATKTMEKYGPPTGFTTDRLIWRDKQPWAEIIISKDEVNHLFPMKHPDVMEQVIYYKVPPDKFDDLAMYDGSVIVERTKGTMSARCDKEEANFLALNLAHDIIQEKRSVKEARAFYAETIKQLMAGEKPEYTQGLTFNAPSEMEGDPDEPAMK